MTNNRFVDIWKQFCIVLHMHVCLCKMVGYIIILCLCIRLWFDFTLLVDIVWFLLFVFICEFLSLFLSVYRYVCMYVQKNTETLRNSYAISRKKSLTTNIYFEFTELYFSNLLIFFLVNFIFISDFVFVFSFHVCL